MEPVACYNCGTPFSMKYDLYLKMYGNVENKTPELWNKTLDTLNIVNICCKLLFLSTMVREDMIKRSTEVQMSTEVAEILKKYESLN